jgi:hypothetical protein
MLLQQQQQSTSQMLTIKRGSTQLWQFLLNLLENPIHQCIIEWTKKSALEFKLLDPEEVARLWGQQKNRPSMNYDKLSRSLRYYYEKGIMCKVAGERYVYRFTNIEEVNKSFPFLFNENKSQIQNCEQKSTLKVKTIHQNNTPTTFLKAKSKLKSVNKSSTNNPRFNPYHNASKPNKPHDSVINSGSPSLRFANIFLSNSPSLTSYYNYATINQITNDSPKSNENSIEQLDVKAEQVTSTPNATQCYDYYNNVQQSYNYDQYNYYSNANNYQAPPYLSNNNYQNYESDAYTSNNIWYGSNNYYNYNNYNNQSISLSPSSSSSLSSSNSVTNSSIDSQKFYFNNQSYECQQQQSSNFNY